MPDAAPADSAPAATGLGPRAAALQVLLAVAAGTYADAALERELSRQRLSAPDRGLATELAYGAIRMRRLLDAWLDALGRVSAERQPPRLRWLLHVGIYQLLFCARIPESAAVSTTVELARCSGLGRLSGVVNAVLRGLLRRRRELVADGPLQPWQGLSLPEDPAASLAIRQSLPDWLAADLLRWLPMDRAEAFACHCNRAPALDLRIQPLRCDRTTLVAALEAVGIEASVLPHTDQGVSLRSRPGDLRELPGYTEGWWSVQDRHAMRIVPLLDPEPGMRVLDACAAPGGKTTQIAECMDGVGELWAVDRSEARLSRLQRNADRLRLDGIHTLAADACDLLELRPDWRGHFDRILVDAPCSGLGTLARHADARWRLQPEAISELMQLQQRLLDGLLPLLAPAGRLVYATCTVEPRENSQAILALMRRYPEWRLIGEQQWWPGDREESGDGFYAAILEAPAIKASEEPALEAAVVR